MRWETADLLEELAFEKLQSLGFLVAGRVSCREIVFPQGENGPHYEITFRVKPPYEIMRQESPGTRKKGRIIDHEKFLKRVK